MKSLEWWVAKFMIDTLFKTAQRVLVSFLLCFGNPAAAGEIAITLDDLPYVTHGGVTPDQGVAQVQAINTFLAAHNITATGFAIGGRIDSKTRHALDTFAGAGHSIGNHSWSHPDYGTLTTRQFKKEVRKTKRALRPWAGKTNFYRFPYLREGETEEAKIAADKVLAKYGYTNAPVTIDNDDWQYNADYVAALAVNDLVTAASIAQRYLDHIKERTTHFQALSCDMLKRDPSHILLLHMNQINADHLGALLDWYATNGWTFISLERAMADPLFSMPDLFTGKGGVSQIERVVGKRSN